MDLTLETVVEERKLSKLLKDDDDFLFTHQLFRLPLRGLPDSLCFPVARLRSFASKNDYDRDGDIVDDERESSAFFSELLTLFNSF